MNKKELKIGIFEVVDINKLKPSEINRALDYNHVERFSKKLSKHNWLDIIKVDNQYNILEGHHRYYSAKDLGQSKVPVYRVYWLDNLTEKERLSVILEYNASNLNWKNEDYLEKYAELDEDYKYVYEKWKEQNKNLSTGTILNIYMNYSKKLFVLGRCKVNRGGMPNYLSSELIRLVKKHTKSKAQSYCLREIVKVSKQVKTLEGIEYILNRYKDMLEGDHKYLTSIQKFRKHINGVLNEYLTLKND